MSPQDSSHFGLSQHVRELALAVLRYLRARMELAGLEGKEAFTQIGGILLLGAVAVTLTMVGYLLLCLALVFGIAKFVKGEHAWIWIAAAFGSLHLVAAWGILRGAKGWLQKPMFPCTLEEFRRDESWLRSTAAKQH